MQWDPWIVPKEKLKADFFFFEKQTHTQKGKGKRN